MDDVTIEEREAFLVRTLDGAGVAHEIMHPAGTVLGRFAYGPTPERALPITASFKPGGLRLVGHRVIEGEASSETRQLIDRANRAWTIARAFHDPDENAVCSALTLYAIDTPPSRELLRAAIHYLFTSSETLRTGEIPATPDPDPRLRIGIEDIARLLREIGYAFERDGDRLRIVFEVKGGIDFVALLRVVGGNLALSASPGEAGSWADVEEPLVAINDVNRRLMTGALTCWEGNRIVFMHGAPLAWLAETDWMQKPRWARHWFEVASFACSEIASAKPA